MSKLNGDDIGILIEALDAWINKDTMGDFMDNFLPALMYRNKEEADRHKNSPERLSEQQERRFQKQYRKETAVCLQAKLIQMRSQLFNVGAQGPQEAEREQS